MLKGLRKKKEEIYLDLLSHERDMLKISKNYKISKYFTVAFNHLKFKLDSDQAGVNGPIFTQQTRLYEELSNFTS